MSGSCSENEMLAPERVGVGRAAAICGFTPKTMRKLAKNGKIPGAAFLGNNWRFDEQRLRDWIRRQEAACLRAEETTSLSVMGSGMPASRFAGATCDEAYEHLLGPKRRSGSLPF
jgi:excisionase family DNA binding protein